MENAKKFFEELIKTEEAKTILVAMDKPETEEERISAYIEIAKKLGVELTAEEIKEYCESLCVSCVQEIDDEELGQLVGGADNASCDSTYTHKENCWWNDGCDRITNNYSDYLCESSSQGITQEDVHRKYIISQFTPLCCQGNVNQKLREAGLL